MKRIDCARLGATVAGVAVVALGSVATGVVAHADTNVAGINYCPNSHVYLFEYEGGPALDEGTGGTALNLAVAHADGKASGSSVGDTVVVCPGTYQGVHAVAGQTGGDDTNGDATKDNVTIRSYPGPGNTIVVTDGTGAPAFTVDANGVTIGGPGLGFTIQNPPSGTPSSPLIEVGTPGAQSTANEDEACTLASGSGQTIVATGCDQKAPAYVAINDRVVDNAFTNLVPQNTAFHGDIRGIELDNTINNTVESNLFTNDVPDHSSLVHFAGLVVGTNTTQTSGIGSSCHSCTTGYSTNINVALFQNAFRQVLQGGNSSCATATAITLDGWVLDSQVYDNLLQQLINNNSKCAVTGIESNAFGSLENEQTGTLAPVNGNIDNNTIGQLGATPTSGTGILLDPNPPTVENDAPQLDPISGLGYCDTTAGPVGPSAMCLGNAAPPSSYTVVDNQFQNLHTALDVEGGLGTNSYAHTNNFQGVLFGIANGTFSGDATNTLPNGTSSGVADVNLDGTNNFWGCDDGPRPAPGTADENNCATIDGPVWFNPWLNSPVQQAGDEAGDNAGH